MENLENQCLEKLNKILSKFDLTIKIIYNTFNVCQYRLVDNSLSKNTYSDWLGLWLSVSSIFLHRNSIFECLKSYQYANSLINDSNFLANITFSTYQRYSEAYDAIKHLENICCIEEFLIKCDLLII